MKHIFLLSSLLVFSITAWSQQNIITLSGGYSFANIAETDAQVTGYRINGLYEFNLNEGPVAHGLSIGYLNTSSPAFSQTINSVSSSTTLEVSSVPVYYAPKYMFGEGKLKGFVKGALGIHFTTYKGTTTTEGGPNNGATSDFNVSENGFYGGASAGLMLSITDQLFINAEYEIAYMANYYYNGEGWMNSPMAGIGFRF